MCSTTNVVAHGRGEWAPGLPPYGPPTKLLVFYFLLMNQLMTSLQMLYCNLRVLLCTKIAVQEEDFAFPNMTSGGTSRGGAKKISRLAIAAIFYFSLINYDIIQQVPQTLSRPEGMTPSSHSSSLSTPSASRSWRLRCLELGPPTFQTKVTPLAGPQASHQLNPALHAPLERAVWSRTLGARRRRGHDVTDITQQHGRN